MQNINIFLDAAHSITKQLQWKGDDLKYSDERWPQGKGHIQECPKRRCRSHYDHQSQLPQRDYPSVSLCERYVQFFNFASKWKFANYNQLSYVLATEQSPKMVLLKHMNELEVTEQSKVLTTDALEQNGHYFLVYLDDTKAPNITVSRQ